jgi:energy-converting hydrogenase A subunit M
MEIALVKQKKNFIFFLNFFYQFNKTKVQTLARALLDIKVFLVVHLTALQLHNAAEMGCVRVKNFKSIQIIFLFDFFLLIKKKDQTHVLVVLVIQVQIVLFLSALL